MASDSSRKSASSSDRLRHHKRATREMERAARAKRQERERLDDPPLTLRAPKRSRAELPPTYVSTSREHRRKPEEPVRSREKKARRNNRRVNREEKKEERTSASSKERREKERKKAERLRRQRLQTLRSLALVAGALFMLALLAAGVYTLLHSSLFYVSTIKVSGVHYMTSGEIKKLAAVGSQESVALLNTDRVEERILKNPWVSQASVSKQLPSTLTIEVSERVPVVMITVGEETWIASSDGKWLGVLDADNKNIVDPTNLMEPVSVAETTFIKVENISDLTPAWGDSIKNESLENTLALLRGLDAEIVARIQHISAPEVARTSLFTIDDIEIDIGEAKDLPEKSQIITTILEEQAGRVVLINVRSIEKPTWRGLSR